MAGGRYLALSKMEGRFGVQNIYFPVPALITHTTWYNQHTTRYAIEFYTEKINAFYHVRCNVKKLLAKNPFFGVKKALKVVGRPERMCFIHFSASNDMYIVRLLMG